MESSDMKNMVVLKNLPSNMVEEAIIIFKETQKVKQKEFVENFKNSNFAKLQPKSKDYILKEAEMLVEDYINTIENKRKIGKNRDLINKEEKPKKYSLIATILFVISVIIKVI